MWSRDVHPVVTDEDSLDDLLDELESHGDLTAAEQVVTIRMDERRYGKAMTIVEGFEGDVDVKSLASELKRTLGTGGTTDADGIELQGDHAEQVAKLLRERGFAVDE